jgi:hypothetical protein
MLRLAVLSGLLAIATVTWGQEAVGPVGAVLTLEQGRGAGPTEQPPGAERQPRGRQKD